MCSILGHNIPMHNLSNKDDLTIFNIYSATKHASRVLTTLVRREIADVQVPIRVTVSCDHLNFHNTFTYFITVMNKKSLL